MLPPKLSQSREQSRTVFTSVPLGAGKAGNHSENEEHIIAHPKTKHPPPSLDQRTSPVSQPSHKNLWRSLRACPTGSGPSTALEEAKMAAGTEEMDRKRGAHGQMALTKRWRSPREREDGNSGKRSQISPGHSASSN